METFGKIMVVLISLVLSTLLSGFVIVQLWEWFISPTFSTRLISIPEALGLSIIIGYMTRDVNTKEDKEESVGRKLTITIIASTSKAVFALLLGWIIVQFM